MSYCHLLDRQAFHLAPYRPDPEMHWGLVLVLGLVEYLLGEASCLVVVGECRCLHSQQSLGLGLGKDRIVD